MRPSPKSARPSTSTPSSSSAISSSTRTASAAFAERFAPLTVSYAREGHNAHPVGRMHRAPETPRTVRNLGDRWHADQSSREKPNMGVALYCLEAPPYGGDTLFANLAAAYAGLATASRRCARR